MILVRIGHILSALAVAAAVAFLTGIGLGHQGVSPAQSPPSSTCQLPAEPAAAATK